MPFNIPIFLTWLRVALIPLVVGVYYLPTPWLPVAERNLAATLVFIVAAITDWFDGYLARRWNQTSAFGAFLDPVADKLMVAGALLVLVQLDRVNAIIAFIIVGREITISALREWMAEIGGRQLARQDQDRGADGRDPDAAVPRSDLRRARHAQGRGDPAVDRRRADGVVDVLLPAPRLAADQGKIGRAVRIDRDFYRAILDT
jgi:phosphatidylglycerophosphate synthase